MNMQRDVQNSKFNYSGGVLFYFLIDFAFQLIQTGVENFSRPIEMALDIKTFV